MLPMPEGNRTVLIVDDDPQILRLVEGVLKPQNVRVLVAPRPSEALRICESQSIDLLISDMKMPDMDGIKLAGRVLRLYPLSGQAVLPVRVDPPLARAAAGNVAVYFRI
jgi:CheY-like chemotaxis protein